MDSVKKDTDGDDPISKQEFELKKRETESNIDLRIRAASLENDKAELEVKKFNQSKIEFERKVIQEERERDRTRRKELWDRVFAGIPIMVAIVAPSIAVGQYVDAHRANTELTLQPKKKRLKAIKRPNRKNAKRQISKPVSRSSSVVLLPISRWRRQREP